MDSISISQSQSPWYSLSNSDRLNEEEKSTAVLKVPCEGILCCCKLHSLLVAAAHLAGEWCPGSMQALLEREYLTSGGNYSVPLVCGASMQVSEV